MFRYLLIGCGFLSTALAVLGMFLPLLPTVPLLLLAAACFMRSSSRFYAWLVNHRHLGPVVEPYLNGEGMPLRAKVVAITILWFSIGLSFVVVGIIWVRILLLVIAVAVTAYLIYLPVKSVLPT